MIAPVRQLGFSRMRGNRIAKKMDGVVKHGRGTVARPLQDDHTSHAGMDFECDLHLY